MSADYTNMIETLLTKNNTLITSLGDLYKEVETEITNNSDTPESIDNTYIANLQLEAKAIGKRVEDNVATINDLTAKNILDMAHYQQEANNFLKRTLYVSSTIPATVQSGETLSASIIFRNMGLFYSWTIDKSITLEIILVDGDNNVVSTTDFLLDTALAGNAPGTETENGDYLKEKTFEIALYVTPVAPGDHTFIMTIKDAEYRFYDSYRLIANML